MVPFEVAFNQICLDVRSLRGCLKHLETFHATLKQGVRCALLVPSHTCQKGNWKCPLAQFGGSKCKAKWFDVQLQETHANEQKKMSTELEEARAFVKKTQLRAEEVQSTFETHNGEYLRMKVRNSQLYNPLLHRCVASLYGHALRLGLAP